MPTIAFVTLGCRVNQYDTDSMRGLFLKAGYTERDFHDAADVYVVNTCSVTQMGEKKSRQLIRRAKKNKSIGYRRSDRLLCPAESGTAVIYARCRCRCRYE